MVTEPAVFVGTVRHRRTAPVRHAFRYRTGMAWLDIDRLPAQMAASRLLGYNRRNVAAFYDADHLDAPAGRLRPTLAAAAARDGVALPDGPIMLLAHLRHFGYVFNPISMFYCFDRGAVLRLVAAEVRNTFGGAHLYWLQPQAPGPTFRATAAKHLYVSPFLPVDMDYSFALTWPAERLAAHIAVTRDGVSRFDATLCLERRPWRAAEIRRLIGRYPVMTATVTAAIHWQALRLWWKGVPAVPRATRDGVNERATVMGEVAPRPSEVRR